ncbi:nucleotidyltransferase family protein [Bacteroides eggerthii]|uniref:Nucleotidyltransferase family protein n=1 Tax=Bacteroides eggerthii TaxID=28111 RepID=A0ABT7U5K4_9BACE|nr:nucleotidyltransferase family protein [Bacteroides eggerthii]
MKENYFLDLLKCSLNNKPFPHYLKENEWTTIYELAKKQTLTGILLDGIKKLPKEQCPPKPILLQWFTHVEKIRKKNQELNQLAIKVSQKFQKDGFKTVILKGQGNALLYPDPFVRTPGDIDIWLSGSRKDIIKYVRKYCPHEEIVYHHAEFPVMKGCDIEVHFTPSWMNNFFKNQRLQKIFCEIKEKQFSNEVNLPDCSGNICIPTSGFNRMYILLHIYRHLFEEGIGLRQLVDYYYVLKQDCPKEEKDNSSKWIRELGMQRFCSAVMYIMQEILGLEKEYLIYPPSKKEGLFLLDEIMRAGNFGKYDDRIIRQIQESHGHKYFRKIKRNIRFIKSYPDEVIWNPVFRLWQFCWRKKNGYL